MNKFEHNGHFKIILNSVYHKISLKYQETFANFTLNAARVHIRKTKFVKIKICNTYE